VADRGPRPADVAAPTSCDPGVRLSVVVPAYRERGRIAATVAQLKTALASLGPEGAVEIIVVDDGSSDGTAMAAEAAGADLVLRFAVNRGKGAAVRAGALAARGAAVAFIDADLSYPPVQLLRLLEEVETGYDMVVGSRRHIETTTLARAGPGRQLSGRVFNLLTRLVVAGRYGDTQCGIKAFSRSAARSLFSQGRIDRFAFDVELFLLAERQGLRVGEVPVELASAAGSTVRLTTDAVHMVRDLLAIRRWDAAGIYDGPPGATPGRESERAGHGLESKRARRDPEPMPPLQ
jgi:dolichyl-phosphate beta-glucosyltransferase